MTDLIIAYNSMPSRELYRMLRSFESPSNVKMIRAVRNLISHGLVVIRTFDDLYQLATGKAVHCQLKYEHNLQDVFLQILFVPPSLKLTSSFFYFLAFFVESLTPSKQPLLHIHSLKVQFYFSKCNSLLSPSSLFSLLLLLPPPPVSNTTDVPVVMPRVSLIFTVSNVVTFLTKTL